MISLNCLLISMFLGFVNGVESVENVINIVQPGSLRASSAIRLSISLKHDGKRSTTFFTEFLKNILTTLSQTITGKKVKNIVAAFRMSLEAFRNYRFIDRTLVRGLGKMSKMYGEEINEEFRDYLNYFNGNHKHLKGLLAEMDHILNAQQAQIFNDYLLDLGDYVNEYVPPVEMEQSTRKVVTAIMDRVTGRSKRDLKDMKEKLKKAVKEYKKEGYGDNPFEFLFGNKYKSDEI